jgi:Mg2+/Co2+ transporter CorC
MNWTLITASNIKTYLHSNQVELLEKDPAFSNEENLLETIIQDSLAEIQLLLIHTIYKDSIPPNDHSVPKGLLKSVCHLIIESLHSRFPVIALTPDQVRNADNARKLIHSFREVTNKKTDTKIIDDFNPPLCKVCVVGSRKQTVSSKTLRGL